MHSGHHKKSTCVLMRFQYTPFECLNIVTFKCYCRTVCPYVVYRQKKRTREIDRKVKSNSYLNIHVPVPYFSNKQSKKWGSFVRKAHMSFAIYQFNEREHIIYRNLSPFYIYLCFTKLVD